MATSLALLDFPTELLVAILIFVSDDVQTLLSVATTCRRLYKIVDETQQLWLLHNNVECYVNSPEITPMTFMSNIFDVICQSSSDKLKKSHQHEFRLILCATEFYSVGCVALARYALRKSAVSPRNSSTAADMLTTSLHFMKFRIVEHGFSELYRRALCDVIAETRHRFSVMITVAFFIVFRMLTMVLKKGLLEVAEIIFLGLADVKLSNSCFGGNFEDRLRLLSCPLGYWSTGITYAWEDVLTALTCNTVNQSQATEMVLRNFDICNGRIESWRDQLFNDTHWLLRLKQTSLLSQILSDKRVTGDYLDSMTIELIQRRGTPDLCALVENKFLE